MSQIKQLDPSHFTLQFLNHKTATTPRDTQLLKGCYEQWSGAWRAAHRELQIDEVVYSDAFTRADEILAVFERTTCVGTLLLRYLNFRIFDYSSDSYFKHWSKEEMKEALANGPNIMVASALAVSPLYRARDIGFSFRDVILDLMIKRFLNSNADTIASITRREKKVHITSYNLGAQPIRENYGHFHDQDRADLVVFRRQKARLLNDPVVRQWSDGLYDLLTEEGLRDAA